MQSEDQATFGAVFGAIVAILPDGWEMNVGLLAGTNPEARFRALASNARTNDMIVLHGSSELIAADRLLTALRQRFAA